jgi:hypothetical protein
MSVLLTSCIDCSNAGKLSLDDLLFKAFVCNGNTAYLNVNVLNSTSADYCGLVSDYVQEDRVFDGVTYTGILITHNLNKTTGLFLAVTDGDSKPVAASGYILSANTFFLILDGQTDGGFCLR